MERADTGLSLKFGTYDEARGWIGRKMPVRTCEDAANEAQIKYFCSLVGDGNPSYWDADWARERWGGTLSPPGMLFVWSMSLPWRPTGKTPPPTVSTQVPLPGDTIINVSTDSRFLRPIVAGDRLTFVEEVVDVTPEKTTQLGPGHFITTELTYRNQRDEVVAVHRNVMLRYRSLPADEASR